MASKCPVCKYAKCRWIELKPNPGKLTSEELTRVIHHNVSYINMTYSGHQGSAYGEERLYAALEPYSDELEARK